MVTSIKIVSLLIGPDSINPRMYFMIVSIEVTIWEIIKIILLIDNTNIYPEDKILMSGIHTLISTCMIETIW